MNLDDDIVIDNYLRGLLTEEEIINFKLKLESSDGFRQNFELEQALWSSQNEADWSFVSSNIDEVETYKKLLAENDMQSLKKNLKQINTEFKDESIKSISNWLYYFAAASIAILICLGVFMNQGMSNQELVNEYLNTSELPSFVSRADSETSKLIQAQEFFENENYQNALDIFIPALETNQNEASIYLYTSIAQMKLKKYLEAESTLNDLINTNLIDAEKGYWYKALLYLEQDRTEDAKAILNGIISKSLFNHLEAKELLNELNNE